ncbi:stealth family protein [Myxococcota bacterium]|nr:stealth family protein [Myxococcota bacterium]
MSRESIDAVYTWVDGAAPGYSDLLAQHATNEHDLNPNRYRDNLDIFRYSLRSLEQHAPWIENVHVVTARPQIPDWMNLQARGLQVVHHDQIFDAEDLPSFNSFGIVANLHRIPGLSKRFAYLADDYLLGRPVELADFVAPDGKILVYLKRSKANDASELGSPDLSRWESALASSNRLLDERYGYVQRSSIHHVPLFVDGHSWRECIQQWNTDFESTAASPFREPSNIAPEYLYPWYLLHEGLGLPVSLGSRLRNVSYLGLDNRIWLQRLGLTGLYARKTKFCCLNDNFGADAHPQVESLVLRFLERRYPRPSRFERIEKA